MDIAHFRMINIELLNKDPDVSTEQATFIILDSKSDVCIAKNGKYTKHNIHIP